MKTLCDEAFRQLANTEYAKSKLFIKKSFGINLEADFDKVKLRLLLIDTLYSTQMNKRHYGVDELAEAISLHSDAILIKEANKRLAGNDSVVLETLFSNKYGINSKGEKMGRAVSLISKYLYFLTDFKFPIYDRLVKNAYKQVITNFQHTCGITHKNITESNFIDALMELNVLSEVNDFEKLDNFMWLSEKNAIRSYSLVISKEDHIKNLQLKAQEHTPAKD